MILPSDIGFTPYPGFDPLDGDDLRVRLSLDNPTRPQSLPDHWKLPYPNGGEKAGNVINHDPLNISTEQRNNG